MEENVRVLTIAELIHRARPLTGTSSLYSHPKRSIPRPSSSSHHRPFPGPTNPNPNPTVKVLTPLNHPSILIGTITLKCSHDNCLRFTDISSEICCDILDFDVRVIGKQINVTAWNFIPLKRGNGFLEILKWKFPDSDSVLSDRSNTDTFDSFPLATGSPSVNEISNSKSRYRIHGALESISPVSVVPCSSPGSLTDPTNLRGFLMRIMICECKFCSSQKFKVAQNCCLFTRPVFVYFFGAATCWHQVMTKLVGNVITILGLKKKLVFIAKEESQLMFVSSENSVLHVPRLLEKWLPVSKCVIKGKGECGVYTGVVKGVYMHGMVVELDNEVWLLLSDKSLTVPHSLRVGAVISLRNVHFVNPQFSWTKILILGACLKTSIIVESFSPLQAGCCAKAESQSLLGNFIESLSFSARLWVLLVISCIRIKFSGMLPEKEILGSKHTSDELMWMAARCYQKKGIAQMYTSSRLPSSVIRPRHGVFMESCKHEIRGCGSEPYCGNLKLVVPISNFIYHCEAKWLKTLLQSDSQHALHESNQISFLSSAGKSYGPSKRRIFTSEDIGIILLGSLKISPYNGRLQLVDTTGSIDVIASDLPLTWTANGIYEVIDYVVMIEGIPELVDQLGLPSNESFSCRSIFNCAPLARKTNLSIFVYFHVSNATSRNLPFYPCVDQTNNFKELEKGAFHLIQVTHKFPLLQKFQGDPIIANRSSMFVEAMVLPWDLVLAREDGTRHSTKVLKDHHDETVERNTGEYYQVSVPRKRHKSDYISNREQSLVLTDELDDVDSESNILYLQESGKEQKCKNLNFSCEIPCLATVRSVKNPSFVRPGSLCYTKRTGNINYDFKNLTAEKVLLEFDSENFYKYQFLQIGCFYITKHYVGDSFCTIKDFDNPCSVKVLITSRTQIWSLTFSSDEVLENNISFNDPTNKDPSFRRSEVLGVDQIELLLQRVPGSRSLESCSDVHLHLSANAIDILKLNLKELEEEFIKPTVRLEETSNISPCMWTTMMVSGQSTGSSVYNCLFPEGNLISLRGDVVAVHGFDDSSANLHVSFERCRDLQLRFFQELARSFCIHVLVDHQLVKVFGTLNEHVYLIGFGAGVNATFHRILEVGEPNSLMLTSVSFVVINSIRLVNEPFSDKYSDLRLDSDTCNIDSIGTVSSGLISELIQCLDCRPMRICCRVVSVHVLVLEKRRDYNDLQLNTHSKPHLVHIPLFGFTLDDGSSSCCCWVNAEKAATLLRLHEELPHSVLESSVWILKRVGIDNCASTTAMYHLEKILKKHDRVIVKNCGSIVDPCYQDLTVSVCSENALSISDESLLKCIIFNACFGTFWTIVASVMDSSALRLLEKEHHMEMGTEMTKHGMQNLWVREVCYTNPITEARNLIEELLDR